MITIEDINKQDHDLMKILINTCSFHPSAIFFMDSFYALNNISVVIWK